MPTRDEILQKFLAATRDARIELEASIKARLPQDTALAADYMRFANQRLSESEHLALVLLVTSLDDRFETISGLSERLRENRINLTASRVTETAQAEMLREALELQAKMNICNLALEVLTNIAGQKQNAINSIIDNLRP